MRAKSIVACLVLLLAAFASRSNAGEAIVARMSGIIGPSSARFMVEAIGAGRRAPGGMRRHRAGHSRRSRRVDARDREEDHDLEGAGRRLRRAVRVAGRFRGGLHHDGGARGGHGSGHQHRRGPSGLHRTSAPRSTRSWPARWSTTPRRTPAPSPGGGAATPHGPRTAVRESVSISETEALKLRVIDLDRPFSRGASRLARRPGRSRSARQTVASEHEGRRDRRDGDELERQAARRHHESQYRLRPVHARAARPVLRALHARGRCSPAWSARSASFSRSSPSRCSR